MRMHPSVTENRIIEAVELSERTLEDPGICTACGEDVEGCEPDMRNGECEHCGEMAVFGAEELLLRLMI